MKKRASEIVQKILAGHPENTQRRYMTALRQFGRYLGAEMGTARFDRFVYGVDFEDALNFLAWLRQRPGQDGRGTADATVRNAFSALRTVFRRLQAVGLLKTNPWDQIRDSISWRQRIQKRPTALIPFDLVFAIIDSPAANTQDGIRDRALLAIMFGGGLRRSEARNVRLRDVQVSAGGKLFLDLGRTKSGRNRHQPMPPWAAERFSVLVSQRKSEGAGLEDFLFVYYYRDGRVRGQISESTQYRLFRDACAQFGVTAAPHAARATAVSMLKAMGKEDRDVQEFLGHSSLRMVGIYDKRRRGVDENCGLALDFPKVSNG